MFHTLIILSLSLTQSRQQAEGAKHFQSQRYLMKFADFRIQFEFRLIEMESTIDKLDIIQVNCYNETEVQDVTHLKIYIFKDSIMISTKNSKEQINQIIFSNILQSNIWNMFIIERNQSQISVKIDNAIESQVWESTMEFDKYLQCIAIPSFNNNIEYQQIEVTKELDPHPLECWKGCSVCTQNQSDGQCNACEEKKVIDEIMSSCQCLNLNFIGSSDHCVTYRQAVQQQALSLLHAIENNQMLTYKFEISLREDSYDYNGFLFTECNQLLTKEVISHLRGLQIYQVMLIIRFTDTILGLQCHESIMGISVIFHFLQIKSSQRKEINNGQIILYTHKIIIDFNQIPPVKQDLVLISNQVFLVNLYFDQSQFFNIIVHKIPTLHQTTLLLSLENITFSDIKYTPKLDMIHMYNRYSTDTIQIRNIIFQSCNLQDKFQLIDLQNTDFNQVIIINLTIENSFIRGFILFSGLAQSLTIQNLLINYTSIFETSMFNLFNALNGQNICILNSNLTATAFMAVYPSLGIVNNIIITNFTISESNLYDSQIISYIQSEQIGQLMFKSFKMNNLTIQNDLFPLIKVNNILDIILDDIQIFNIITQSPLMSLAQIDTLFIAKLIINQINSVQNDCDSGVLQIINASQFELFNIKINNIEADSYLIQIYPLNTITNITISQLYIYEVIAYQILSFDMQSCAVIKINNLFIYHKARNPPASFDMNPPIIVQIMGNHVQISNSNFVVLYSSVSISANYSLITQSEFRSTSYYSILQIFSQKFNLLNNKFYNTLLFIKNSTDEDVEGSKLELIDNIFRASGETNRPYLIFIEWINIFIANNNFELQINHLLFLIRADNHQIALFNNTFRAKQNPQILYFVLTERTVVEINQTIITTSMSSRHYNQMNQKQHHESPIFFISYGYILSINLRQKVIIQDLLIVNSPNYALILLNIDRLLLRNIEIQDSEIIESLVVLKDIHILQMKNLTFKNIQLIKNNIELYPLIIYYSKLRQPIVSISQLIIKNVTFDALLVIELDTKNIEVIIDDVSFLNNNCLMALLLQGRTKKIIFRLSHFRSKRNRALEIIATYIGGDSDIIFSELVMDNQNQVLSINTSQYIPITNSEIYEYHIIQGQQKLYNILQLDQNAQIHIPMIFISFNNGTTFQKSILSEKSRIMYIQLEGRNKSSEQYVYIPPFGYSFQNYSRLNKKVMTYQLYTLVLKFDIQNTQVVQPNHERCSLEVTGSANQYQLLNIIDDISIKFYEPDKIKFNMTCTIDYPITLIFYAKQFKCQIGEINKTNKCIPCPSNSYSLHKTDQFCKDRDTKTMIFVNMGLIELRKGFWRSGFYTDIIEPCLIWMDSCQGGEQQRDQSCKEGYVGGACFECDSERQYYRQIDGTCAKPSYLIIVNFFIWIWLSILLLNTNISSNLQYIESRKRFNLLYYKFSQICTRERVNIIQTLLFMLAEYQQQSSLITERYTNSSNILNSYIYHLSYTELTPFAAIDQLFSSFFVRSNWIYYRLFFYIALCGIFLNLYQLKLLLKIKFNGQRFKIIIVFLIVHYLIQLNIFGYCKQLIQILIPIRLSSELYIYNQMDILFMPSRSQVIKFCFINGLFLFIVLYCSQKLIKLKKLQILINDPWNVMTINSLLTLLIGNILRKNQIYRSLLNIIQVEFCIKVFKEQKLYHNHILLKIKILILRIITLSIVLDSLMNIDMNPELINIGYLKSIIWIGMNAYIVFEIIKSINQNSQDLTPQKFLYKENKIY